MASTAGTSIETWPVIYRAMPMAVRGPCTPQLRFAAMPVTAYTDWLRDEPPSCNATRQGLEPRQVVDSFNIQFFGLVAGRLSPIVDEHRQTMAHLEGFEPPSPSSEDWRYTGWRRVPFHSSIFFCSRNPPPEENAHHGGVQQDARCQSRGCHLDVDLWSAGERDEGQAQDERRTGHQPPGPPSQGPRASPVTPRALPRPPA